MSKLAKLFKGKETPVKVEEKKPPRSSGEIQKEYAEICARIGNLDYMIYIYENDLDLLRQQARALNNEGAEAKQREALEASQPKEAPSV